VAEIRVRGLKELQGAFRTIDGELPKELRVEFKAIAMSVAEKAARDVPRLTGAAARSIKPRATQKGFGLAAGGDKAPHYPWLDFGGRVGRNRSIARPVIAGGRYLYPTIAENREEIGEATDAAIKRAVARAGFDQEGSL
jgi:hypothetical protein